MRKLGLILLLCMLFVIPAAGQTFVYPRLDTPNTFTGIDNFIGTFQLNSLTIPFPTGTTGTGNLVYATNPLLTNPTFTTPTLGIFSGTSGTLTSTLSLNGTILAGSGGGTWTFRNAADNVLGANTTDIFTNKTFDTAGAGNVWKVAGQQINAITGIGSTIPTNNAPTITNIPPNGAIAPGALNQCYITNGGGNTVWGGCSGQSAVTLVDGDQSTVSANGNTTALQSLHSYSFTSGTRNFNGARFHSESWMNAQVVNTTETVSVVMQLSDGTHTFNAITFNFIPLTTSIGSCCFIIVDFDCTVKTIGSPALIYCGVKAAGQNLNITLFSWFEGNLVNNINSGGVITMTEQMSFTTASTSNIAGSSGLFVYDDN